ncbi:hypothetical protein [Paracoccus sp. APAP_BH8]|uniref:hypothetical protein n=1 Tax=Paracoccus sp. APAP_BH8 TaxID=3110237 RepID=UPI003FA7B6DD
MAGQGAAGARNLWLDCAIRAIHNTIDAVLYCKARGVEAYQGGTCNETDMNSVLTASRSWSGPR